MVKKIALLGSTGSIGTQTLEVVDEFRDLFKIEILTGHTNGDLLLKQVQKYHPSLVVATNKANFLFLKNQLVNSPTKVLFGLEGINSALEETKIDLVVGAISGAAGILPTIKALELGIDVALANKETIVAAGSIVKKIQKKTGAQIIPVDSEHSAIFQCLTEESKAFKKIILTASGGPFRNYTKEELKNVTKQKALKHPNWQMGKKVTIDSATMMNKGLEIIEAHWLFDAPYENIEPVIHPQSIVHSMVEYGDGSILAQLGLPDMRTPIQYALTYPIRQNNSFPKLNLVEIGKLEFFKPDFEKFPCLKLAYEAGKIGYTMPIVLNAANEIAVQLFLDEKIKFIDIPCLVEWVMEKHTIKKEFNLEDLFVIDAWARKKASLFPTS